MPKALEQLLKKRARNKGLQGLKADAYVYGALRKTGWTPTKQKSGYKKKRG